MALPPGSSPHQVVRSNNGTPHTAHSEICAGVLFVVVTMVERRNGPCQLCNSDDDDGDDDDMLTWLQSATI